MVAPLTLASENGTIRAVPVNIVPAVPPIYWMRCYLSNHTEAFLGATDAAYLANHLKDWLETNTLGQIEWVLSLAEEHTSFYGEHQNSYSILRIQNEHAVFIHELRITADERAHWKDRVNEFIQTQEHNLAH